MLCNQLVIGPTKWATLFYPFFGTFFGDVDSTENVTCVLYVLRYVNDLGKSAVECFEKYLNLEYEERGVLLVLLNAVLWEG